MLIKAKTLKGYKLNGLDGEIGKVDEFYFDDQHWVVRYLVADTGYWLADRQVLISPYALLSVDKDMKHINLDLTKKQIEDSPLLSTDKPVSRQFEEDYYGHFGWPMYSAGPFIWGAFSEIERDHKKWITDTVKAKKSWDPHLRSTHDVSGHHIQASDGVIGHVEDFIIDDQTWAIRYLIIDTKNWLPGKMVLVSPEWIERVSWSDAKVYVNLSSENIKNSPEYIEESHLTRDYEAKLYQHYNRQRYWLH